MSRVKALHVVYARWCPHCVPTTVEPLQRAAGTLGIPCHLYDIDTDAEQEADGLVRRFGDWAEDYLIPQVFVELEDGGLRHVLTGCSESVELTRRSVENLINRLLQPPTPPRG